MEIYRQKKISFFYNKNNKQKFFSYSNIIILLMLSLLLLPITTNISINTIYNNLYLNSFSAKLQTYSIKNHFNIELNKPSLNIVVTSATYIKNIEIIARQINNNNLQNYISNSKHSTVKLKSGDNSKDDKIYFYDSYGNIIELKNKSNSIDFLNLPNSFRYNGEQFDDNTKLQYLYARFYNSEIKRFLTQDTYDLLNKFNYVNSNPIMNSDPDGHMLKKIRTYWSESPTRAVSHSRYGTFPEIELKQITDTINRPEFEVNNTKLIDESAIQHVAEEEGFLRSNFFKTQRVYYNNMLEQFEKANEIHFNSIDNRLKTLPFTETHERLQIKNSANEIYTIFKEFQCCLQHLNDYKIMLKNLSNELLRPNLEQKIKTKEEQLYNLLSRMKEY